MSRICLITALAAETRPLLDALPCRQYAARHLRLYCADHYVLLETGLGKLNAAAATGAALQLFPDIALVVNIGIAGGRFNVGKTLVAHRVKDEASGAQWFPHLPDSGVFRDTDSATLSTVDTPSTDYREGIMFDMEAAGIFTAATRHLSTSQVHSIKVISDNPDRALESISKQGVTQLVGDALPGIMHLLDALSTQHIVNAESVTNQANSKDLDALMTRITQTTHHSINDEQQLRRLLQQHQVLAGKLPELLFDTPVSASTLRYQLRATIDQIPFLYGDSIA